MTKACGKAMGFGESALRELKAEGEIEPSWRFAYETTEVLGDTKVSSLWFEKDDRSDSFLIRHAVRVAATPEETERDAVDEIKRLIRARRL